MGSSRKRVEDVRFTQGKGNYVDDLKLPGMLYAGVAMCPVPGGALASVNADVIEAMKGVKKVVPVGETAVAVVAETFWVAKTDLEAVQIQWDEGPHASVSSASIAQMLQEGLSAEQAYHLAQATFGGATHLSRQSAESPEVLRQRVTSKGGTTYAALTAMADANMKESFIQAMLAAQRRAGELGDEFGKD